MYRLKNNVPDFVVVDGKFAGRKFKSGEVYETIPEEEKNKFEVIKTQSPPKKNAGDKEYGGEGGKKQ